MVKVLGDRSMRPAGTQRNVPAGMKTNSREWGCRNRVHADAGRSGESEYGALVKLVNGTEKPTAANLARLRQAV